MALLDRVNPDSSSRIMSFHELASAIFLITNGTFTILDFKTAYGLDGTDDAQINALVALYNTLDDRGKDRFGFLIESAGTQWEAKRLITSSAEFITAIGL